MKEFENTTAIAAAYQSAAQNIQFNYYIGLQLDIANTNLVGSAEVQVSNDGVTWNDYVFEDGSSSITISTGDDVNEFIEFQTAAFLFRVNITFTSGAGTLKASYHGKDTSA